ncbi:MAG: cold shock domain-containing protein [Campylobacterales bacterium]|jgi:cold shock CspA family protein
MQRRFEGTVIWYDDENGYGIIQIRSDKKTVSIDNSQIHHQRSEGIRALRVGQDVSFEIVNTQAHNLYFL